MIAQKSLNTAATYLAASSPYEDASPQWEDPKLKSERGLVNFHTSPRHVVLTAPAAGLLKEDQDTSGRRR